MKGPKSDVQDGTGRTALHQAVVGGDLEGVVEMLASGADPNVQDAHLQTPITLAAERGLVHILKALAEHGPTDVNLQDSFGRTPLHWCAKRCDADAVELLLWTGKANVNTKTGGGDTPLHWACSNEGDNVGDAGKAHGDAGDVQERSMKVAELLVAAGADLEAKNDQGATPVDVVVADDVKVLLTSALEVQRAIRAEEEEAEAEREREARAAKMSKIEGAGSSTIVSGRGVQLSWPSKQGPGQGLGFSELGGHKKSSAGRSSAEAPGGKKKVVIKLKKKG